MLNLCAESEGAKTATEPATFYVAVKGNDAWSGTLAEPNSAKTDGPFATLSRARDAVRELRGKQPPAGAITVVVRGGTYYLDSPLVFEGKDGGSRKFSVRYKGATGEKVVLSGGRKIIDWEPYKGKILKATVPGGKGEEWTFRQLFLNGAPQMRSRYPKYNPDKSLYEGWLFAAGGRRTVAQTSVIFKPGSFPRAWAKPETGEVVIFPQKGWANAYMRIRSVDEKNRLITSNHGYRNVDIAPIFQPFDNFDGSGDRFRVENLLEELTEPGEWCFDHEDGVLYFWPPDGLLKKADEVVAPALSTLIDINGASWLSFSGFTLSQTAGGDDMQRLGVDGADAMTPNQGLKYCGEAIHMRDAQYCTIENNCFYWVGGNGIYLERHNSRNVIRRNEISHAGANGICLLGNHIPIGSVSESMPKGRQQMPVFNEVTDNYLHHCGMMNKYVAGIFLGVGDSNWIAHNKIEYLPHHAINLGSNGFGRNLVEYNEIHFVCLEIWDTAAINLWMEDAETEERAGHVIRFNLVADVIGCHTNPQGNILTPDGAANGIYLDNNASNCLIHGNIIVRPSGYGVYIHGGQHNYIENNIVVDATVKSAVLTIPNSQKTEYTGFTGQIGYYGYLDSAFLIGNRFYNNIVYYRQGQYARPTTLIDLRPRGDNSQSRGDSADVISASNRNLFFRYDNGPYLITDISQAGSKTVQDVVRTVSFTEWQQEGFDQESITADPLFADPAHDNYRLQPNSPALLLGFAPIDMTKIGIRPLRPSSMSKQTKAVGFLGEPV
jgi:parallel beta-helix repeat protein